jgi:hypothetical protein
MSTNPNGPLASGFDRKVVIGKETVFGVKPARDSGSVLRRTAVDLNPTKDTIESDEIRDDYQIVEFRHGIRRAQGTIAAELGLGSHTQFLQSLLRRDFTVGATYAADTGDGATLAAATVGVDGTITRAAGGSADSFLADGFKIGDVVRLTGSNVPAALRYKNIKLTQVTDTTLHSPDITVSATSVTADFSVVTPGKRTWFPVDNHTTDSYTIEVLERYVDESIAYLGTRIGSCDIEISPNALTTLNFGAIAKDFEAGLEANASSTDIPYFNALTTGCPGTLLAGPQGTISIGGQQLAIVTQSTINIENNLTADPVIGSLTVPEIFYGRMNVSGQFTMYIKDYKMLKYFNDESELTFHVTMEAPTDGTVHPDFFSIFMPRIKLSGFSAADNQGGIIQTLDFQALKVKCPTDDDQDTTIVFQDSSLS